MPLFLYPTLKLLFFFFHVSMSLSPRAAIFVSFGARCGWRWWKIALHFLLSVVLIENFLFSWLHICTAIQWYPRPITNLLFRLSVSCVWFLFLFFFFLPFSLEFASVSISVSISVSVSVPVSVFVSVWAGNAGGSLVVGLAVTPARRLVALVPAPPPLPAAVAAAVVVVVAAVAGLNTSCQLKWRICTFFFLLDAIMAMVMNCGNWRWINRWWRPC